MKNLLPVLFACLAGLAIQASVARSAAAPQADALAASPVTGTMEGQVLTAGNRRVMILSQQGQVVWEYPAGLVHDAWMLPDGHVLFADGASVTEVTPDKKVVFQYKSADQKGGGTYACQRLANGNTVIGENSTGRVLEVDKAGKVVFEMKVEPTKGGAHHNMRMVRKLDSGNYLVCHSGAHLVKEYTPQGKAVLEIKTDNVAFSAIRTPKGTTLVASLSHLREYDASGKVVWEFANTDLPGVTITNMTGLHLLAGGNIAVGCYSAYKGGQGTGLFEITPEKKLVWRYSNPKADGTMMPIEVLTPEGKALPGPCLR